MITLIIIVVIVTAFVLFSLGYGLFHLIKEA